MDQISLWIAAMLGALSPQSPPKTAASNPSPSPAIHAEKKQSPPPPAASNSEHACADFGKPDAYGNLNYFCHN